MTRVLWGGGEAGSDDLLAYTAADDRVHDRRILFWDVVGTLGHLEALRSTEVLSGEERLALIGALREAAAAVRSGALTVGEDDEDAHTALEHWLVARVGEPGERIHTGRSRNDQVQAALRLFMKDRLLTVAAALVETVGTLLDFADPYRRVVWPGYTHLRPAMPSTVGLWAASFAEALLDDLGPLDAVTALVDRSPLGSAAGYGVPLDLDRGAAARALGFASVQANVIAVQSARGKLEAQVVSALWPIGFDLGKLAWDVVLFSAPEYGYLRLARELGTGSSIMPHKNNPDLFELVRGRAAVLDGLLAQAVAVSGRLPSGYHRDLQESKGPVMAALDTVEGMLGAVTWAVPKLEVDVDRCTRSVSGGVLATDEVYRRVRDGAPFRRAYREVAAEQQSGAQAPHLSAEDVLQTRATAGGPGAPGLGPLRERTATVRAAVDGRRAAFEAATAALLGRDGDHA